MNPEKTQVKTTYLELYRDGVFVPAPDFGEIEVREVENDAYLNLVLFAGVGLVWRWFSRFSWTPDDWDAHFAQHRVKTFLGFYKKELVGYFELEFSEESAEISFLGLFPRCIGRGFGKKLLTHAVEVAWSQGVSRVWLHTCSLDAEHALTNYLARGFHVYNETETAEVVPEPAQLIEGMSRFMSRYAARHAPVCGNIHF